MEIPFTHQGYQGRVIVTLETTLAPQVLGAPESGLVLPTAKQRLSLLLAGI